MWIHRFECRQRFACLLLILTLALALPLGVFGQHSTVCDPCFTVGCTDSTDLAGFPEAYSKPSAAIHAQPSLGIAQPMASQLYPSDASSTGCPVNKPCPEQGGGQSLYWQDICLGGYRHAEPLFHDSRRACFFASVESLALHRDVLGSQNVLPLLSSGPLSGGTIETDFENGVRGTVGTALGDWYRLEFTWLKQFDWSERLTGTSVGTTEVVEFETSLESWEVNLRRRVRIRDWPQHYPDYWNGFEFSTLLGYRSLKVDEDLLFNSQTLATTSQTETVVSNESSGVQLGCLAQWLYVDRGWVDLQVKGAILSNEVSLRSGTGPINLADSQTAFLADVALSCNYQFSRCLTLQLGYQMIWLSGIALAQENVATSGGVTLSSIDRGESIYHGPSLGLVFAR